MKNKHQRLPETDRYRLLTPASGFLLFTIVQFLLLMCCMNVDFCMAQAVAPPLDSFVKDESGTVTVFVALPDSTSSTEIEVAIGSKNNIGDLFSHTYAFDQTSGLPAGLSYIRQGTDVFLGAGAITLTDAYNVKIRLKDGSGNWSSYYDYVSN
ncbi:MAG: hypothetical protein IPP71_00485 [Bacteroidetes bacterium]|nr:hypothetical protein [Bacteroidota bacterium]